jgi:LIM and senescent cell antigen-like-containing domain protein 1/2
MFDYIFSLFLHSGMIDDQPLRFRGEVYHGYHFNCTTCGTELDSTAREVKSRPGFAANDMVKKILD